MLRAAAEVSPVLALAGATFGWRRGSQECPARIAVVGSLHSDMQKEISMKHKMNSLLAVAGLACALAIPAGLSAQSAATPPPPQGGQGQGRMQTQFPGLRE